MVQVPDINETEVWILNTTLKERYGEEKEVQLGDAEIRLFASDRELTPCPVFFWQADGCHFVIFKSGDKKYRCQFYYKPYRQMGTGVPEYDDLTECVVSLLQVQADYEAKERGDIPSKSR